MQCDTIINLITVAFVCTTSIIHCPRRKINPHVPRSGHGLDNEKKNWSEASPQPLKSNKQLEKKMK